MSMSSTLLMNLVIGLSAATYLVAIYASADYARSFWAVALVHGVVVLAGVCVSWTLPILDSQGHFDAVAFVLKVYGPLSLVLGQLDYHLLGRIRRRSIVKTGPTEKSDDSNSCV